MIEFKIEPVLECKDEMLSLLEEHYQELTLNKHIIKLNPNWAEYKRREDAGKFKYISVRDNGQLVGYSAWFIDTHIHYADLIVAMNDVIFLKDKYRLGLTGVKLIKFSEQTMRDLGVHKIVWHIKESNNFSPILKRMGYNTEDILMGKIC